MVLCLFLRDKGHEAAEKTPIRSWYAALVRLPALMTDRCLRMLQLMLYNKESIERTEKNEHSGNQLRQLLTEIPGHRL